MRVIELFAGIGACSKALKNIGIDVEIVDAVEIDKYAIRSFNAIHNTDFKPQDIKQWNKEYTDIDLITHGSPCQDFSLAGRQAGGDENSGTRSSLMYETLRIVEKIRPKYVLWENVKNILSKKHKHNFDAYIERMKQLGYKNYYQVLNAKDYGIPQNRERVFTISVLGSKSYEFPERVDCNNEIKVVGNYMPSNHDASRIVDEDGIAPTVKENHGTVTAVLQRFEFPKEEKLQVTPSEMLEKNVDEKYFLDEKTIKTYQRDFGSKGKEINIEKPIPTLTASMGTGGGNVPYFVFPAGEELKIKLKNVMEREVDKKYYLTLEKIKKIAQWKAYQKPLKKVNGKNSIVQTLTARGAGEEHSGMITYSDELKETTNIQEKIADPSIQNIRIRKLTPLECWRLMGFYDEDFYSAKYGFKIDKETAFKITNKLISKIQYDIANRKNTMSNTQLYKQAGNSIVVNVLEKIFANLLKEEI